MFLFRPESNWFLVFLHELQVEDMFREMGVKDQVVIILVDSGATFLGLLTLYVV